AGAAGQNLARVPVRRIAVSALVDREVALEHAALGAEAFDAGLEIRPPGICQCLGGERVLVLVEIETADAHAEPPELHVCVRTTRERPDRDRPAREHFRALPPIAADSERAADVVEYDLRLWKRLRERRELVDLGMIKPPVERKAERRKTGESFTKTAVGQQTRRWPVARVHDRGIGVPGADVTNATEAVPGDAQMRLEHLRDARAEL